MTIVFSGCSLSTLRQYAVVTLRCELTRAFCRLHLSIYVLWSWKQRGSGFRALLCPSSTEPGVFWCSIVGVCGPLQVKIPRADFGQVTFGARTCYEVPKSKRGHLQNSCESCTSCARDFGPLLSTIRHTHGNHYDSLAIPKPLYATMHILVMCFI